MIISFKQKAIASVLTLILLAYNINTMIVVGSFIVNQETISKTLCVQKEAQKGCHGKCQLRKSLSENNNDKNSDFPSQNTKELTIEVFYIPTTNHIELNKASLQNTKKVTNTHTKPLVFKYYDIDTPPPLFC